MTEDKLWWENIKVSLQNKTKEQKLFHSLLNTLSAEHYFQKGKKYLTLKVPSALYQNFLQKFLPAISFQIQKHGFEKKIQVCKDKEFSKKSNYIQSDAKKSFLETKSSFSSQTKTSFYSGWTFSSFISGPNNRFALSLAKAISKCPAQRSTNPLFIYGSSGLGKTHLLHAIGHSLKKHHPQLRVCYLPMERFFNECITHIRKNTMSLFRDKYRNHIQVILLDDVQILGKGRLTQDEFFHTFEVLNSSGCQIVLTCDRKPKHIQGLKERIITRFGGGVIAHIQEPDIETKVAILKNKACLINLTLSEESFLHIAKSSYHSIRELEGCLNKIKMFSELENQKTSLNLVKTLIQIDPSYLTPNKSILHSLSIHDLIKEVALFFNLLEGQIKSSSRQKTCVRARHLIMYISKKHLLLSVLNIAKCLGKKDHSSVVHAFKKFQLHVQEKKAPHFSDYKDFLFHLSKKNS